MEFRTVDFHPGNIGVVPGAGVPTADRQYQYLACQVGRTTLGASTPTLGLADFNRNSDKVQFMEVRTTSVLPHGFNTSSRREHSKPVGD